MVALIGKYYGFNCPFTLSIFRTLCGRGAICGHADTAPYAIPSWTELK